MNKRKPCALEISKYGRPVVWIAEYSINTLPETACAGYPITSFCVFSSRREAIKWAKFSAKDNIHWKTWKPSTADYPFLRNSDREDLEPTFVATWHKGTFGAGGFVRVRRSEVNAKFDWAAVPVHRRRREAA